MKRLLAFMVLMAMGRVTGFSQTNAEYLCASASNDFFAGRYSSAVTNLTAEIALNPRDYNAYLHRGMSKYWLRDYHGAVADYDKAIDYCPVPCGGFYCNRGQSKFALGDVAGALADYNKAIELDPNAAEPYFNRGVLNSCVGQNLTNAIADFTKAIELHTDAREDDIFIARANARMQLKNLTGAVGDLKKALQVNPSNETARTNLTLLQKAVEVSPRQLN